VVKYKRKKKNISPLFNRVYFGSDFNSLDFGYRIGAPKRIASENIKTFEFLWSF
jgi:hypothetical protein